MQQHLGLESSLCISRLVFAFDPTDSDDEVIPIGKQTLNPSHIFYTPCSGIWQSVWIEAAPANYITELQLFAGADGQGMSRSLSLQRFVYLPQSVTVNATVSTSNNGTADVVIVISEKGSNVTVCTQKGSSNTPLSFSLDGTPKLWTPESPNLYDVTIKLGDDVVSSYTAFRTISRGLVDGIERPLLNGEFTFIFGTLDQGFWPDGIYTPPNREAMVYDLQALKNLGFNMLRKHVSATLCTQPATRADMLLRSKSKPRSSIKHATRWA